MSDETPVSNRSYEAARFLAMKRQAEEKVLLVSPPYSDESTQRAFLSGYETALRDIARGLLDVR